MIKKILLGLGISLISFFGFSYGGNYVNFGEKIEQYGGNFCNIGQDLSFNCDKGGSSLTSVPGNFSTTSFFWTSDGLGGYFWGNGNPKYTVQKLVDSFFICEGDTSFITTSTSFINTSQGCPSGFNKIILDYGDFVNYLKAKVPRLVGSPLPISQVAGFSLIYDNFFFSIYGGGYAYGSSFYGVDNFYEVDLTTSGTGFDLSFGNIINSPFGSSGGGNVSNSLINSSAIEYLEKVYNFNTSLCYVGIDDLSVNYGGAGSFIVGGGKTIFELFDYMNGSSESVSNVGIWINSWIINYQQWFDNYGKTAEPTYLTNYSNGQVSVYYDNLTFPFLNKPAGLYFMANNLYDSSVSSNGNMGQELAIYCDLKLNGENASPIPEDSDLYKNVINYEYFNKNNGNSYYDGSGNLIIYQKPGEDSIFNDDYFGDFSGDYTDYFKGYEEIFNNFTSKFNIREYRTVGIIPGYILFFFALVVLFKLIRK